MPLSESGAGMQVSWRGTGRLELHPCSPPGQTPAPHLFTVANLVWGASLTSPPPTGRHWLTDSAKAPGEAASKQLPLRIFFLKKSFGCFFFSSSFLKKNNIYINSSSCRNTVPQAEVCGGRGHGRTSTAACRAGGRGDV